MMCMTALLVLAAALNERKFNRLQAVETYEIRPGILMMPIYSDAGEVCRIVLEKRHVSSKSVDLEAEMSAEEIYGIFDEVAPKMERGQPKLNLPEGGSITLGDGPGLSTIAAYENVSIQLHGKRKNADIRDFFAGGYVAATIDWNKRKCKR
jgi:hypothetical protein